MLSRGMTIFTGAAAAFAQRGLTREPDANAANPVRTVRLFISNLLFRLSWTAARDRAVSSEHPEPRAPVPLPAIMVHGLIFANHVFANHAAAWPKRSTGRRP